MSSRPDTSTPTSEDAYPRSDAGRAWGVERARVCVLAGGRSSERAVSLDSGAQITAALTARVGAHDARGPARTLGVEIEEGGGWRVGGRVLAPGRALEELVEVDLFFLALHGGEGEDGSLQGLLATHDRAHTGSGVCASAVAMDKVLARHVVAAAGLAVAPCRVVGRDAWRADARAVLRALVDLGPGGWAVKPRAGGSSVGCSQVEDERGLPDALERALLEGDEVLVEAWVRGTEVAAGVLATPDRGLEALPLVEIRPRAGRFFDYEQKYSATGAEELCPPVSVGADASRAVQQAALAAHRSLGCAGYSRTDFILPADGAAPVFLETNTLPGMTRRSLLPRAAGEAGIDFRTLCLWIAADGLARRRGPSA